MIWEFIEKLFSFGKKDKVSFIIVREGNLGLECFCNENAIKKLPSPMKRQLGAFIDEVKILTNGKDRQ